MRLPWIGPRFATGRLCLGNGRKGFWRSRLCAFFCIIWVFFVILWGYANFSCPVANFASLYESQRSSMDARSPLVASPDQNRIILFWVPFFTKPDYYLGYGHQPFLDLSCPVANCMTTSDRSLLSHAHAVIFHMRNINEFDLPSIRHPDQRWIFFLYEAPPLTWVDLRQFRNVFNWTMTYRQDSDVPANFTYRPKSLSQITTSGPRHKTKLIAWIVSNCQPYSRRDDYVRELSRYVPVDIYGDCGVRTSRYCSPSTQFDECLGNLEKDYKFYLAFENAVCRDYVTEKWYKSSQYDMVPVVYGGANYSAFAAPHSYIDILDFPSPRHLAAYLMELNHDDHLYRSYLSWKESYEVVADTVSWCHLCAKLNDPSEPTKVYEDVHKYWVENGECSTPLQLPEMGQTKLQRRLQYFIDVVFETFYLQLHALESLVKWWLAIS